ncbi:ATP-grasp domain-containing protein [Nocardia amikacinitolerans]|uniref:ATP-grasp domain-containing protein n=1 Tax=Nocardia amikacinitolerans TaxID=756689 RepID=UPI002646734B|nr:ATP-grasp domain-containing protein [Nocardia amikacinitolerans]
MGWLEFYDEHRNELVVVSEVVNFEREYRCFCRNGRFFCGSAYPIEPYLPGWDNRASSLEVFEYAL